jgi:hypothetical protein
MCDPIRRFFSRNLEMSLHDVHTNYKNYIYFICLILANFTNLTSLFINVAIYYYTCPSDANLGQVILRRSLFYSVYRNEYWGRDMS